MGALVQNEYWGHRISTTQPSEFRNVKNSNVCWDLGMLDFALLEMLEFLDSQNSAKGKRNLCRNFGTPGQLEFMSKILGKKQSH